MRTVWEQLVAELIGTLALVFIGAGSVVVLAPQLAGGTAILGIALAHALVLAVMVSNLGHISGAHFNPAVTIGVWVAGKIETLRGGLYIVAQLAGAAVGALLLRVLLPEELWVQTKLGLTQINRALEISNTQAFVLEGILTFFLVLTVFATAIDDRGVFRSVAGLTIGLVLGFDILMGGTLTGASMNPARSFGPAIVAGEWSDFWVYVVGPVSGAVVAASVYLFAFLRGREIAAPRTETPIGGGPEEELP
jgi:MIP family channel proteins